MFKLCNTNTGKFIIIIYYLHYVRNVDVYTKEPLGDLFNPTILIGSPAFATPFESVESRPARGGVASYALLAMASWLVNKP